MNRTFLFVLYVWGLFHLVPYATADKLNFRSLKIEDGLPYNAVRSITSDQQGYIWIGTELGLARYDGYSVTSYLADAQNSSSLTANYIKQLTTDGSGQLWLSNGKGISQYQLDSNNFQHWQKENGKTSSLSSNRVQSFVEDQEGNFWIATDKGLDKFDPTSGHFQHYPNSNSILDDLLIRSLLVHQDQLYVGTNKGLFVRNDDGEIRSIKVGDGKQPVVRSLIEAASGEIWFGTHEGLFAYQPKTETTRRVNLNGKVKYVLSLLRDDQNNIWVGTFDWGLFRVDKGGTILNFRPDKSDAMSLADKTVLSLHQDPSGIIWAGTYNHGVSYFDPLQLTFGAHDNSLNSLPCLSSSDIRSAKALDNETVMLGTLRGATLFNLSTRQCRHFKHKENQDNTLSDNEVFAIEAYNSNTVWLGTGSGLDKLSLKDGSIERFGNLIENALVFDIVHDKDLLYLATNRGVFYFDPSTKKAQKVASSTTNGLVASVFTKVANGLLYVGTNKGLFKIDKQQNKLEAVEFDDTLELSKSVYSLSTAENSEIYFTVEEKGIFHWNPDNKILTDLTKLWKIPVAEGFTGIYQSKDDGLWITTVQKGIYYRDLKQSTTTNYRTVDGLVSDVFNLGAVTQFPDGRWLFGNREGFNLFDPNLIKVNMNPPLVSLSDMTLNGNQVSYVKSENKFGLYTHISKSDKLNLSFREPVFGFDILATHYVEPSKLTYKYRLLGLNTDWITLTSQQRSVAFSNLAPGEYNFELTAITNKGVENISPVVLPISVATPPWKTWWAIAVYILFVLSVLASVYWIRTRSLRNQAIVLMNTVKSRTKELENEKEKIESLLSIKNDELANVSHEFRTPLTLILGPLAQVIESLKNATAISRLKVVQRNAFRLLRMVDQLLNLETFRIKTITQKSTQPISQIVDQLTSAFADLAKEKGIILTSQNDISLSFSFTPDAFEKIILNLLSNALKYTSSGGQVRVKTERSPKNELIIQVKDTGIGIPKAQLNSIFDRYSRVIHTDAEQISGSGIGLSLVKSLIEAHHGRIEVLSEVGLGSTFTIYLPIIDETNSLGISAYSNDEILNLEMKSFSLDSSGPHFLDTQNTSDGLANNESTIISYSEEASNFPSILIVEDNLDMQGYLLEILEPTYKCEVAPDGKQGFERAKDIVPDIILSDVMMPNMDGYTLAEKLRTEMLTCHIPIVFLTAKGDKESRLEGWRRDIDEYLTKPFDPKELTLRLKNILSIRQILADKLKNKQIGLLANSKTNELSVPDKRFLDKLSSYIESNYADPNLGLANVARGVAISERQLQRKLKAVLNKGLTEYIRDYRLAKSKDLLKQGISVIDVSMLCGFSSQSYFSSCFKALYEITPKKYQQSSR